MISSPHPLQFPLGRVVERVGGRGIGAVAARCNCRGGEGDSDGGGSGGCGEEGFSCFSTINDRLPWLMAGSVGESGLKKAAGIGGTSSMVFRMRPGSSRMVCRVRAGNSSTRGLRFRGSLGLNRLRLVSEGRLDIELPLLASDGDDSDDTELSVFFFI